MSIPRVNDVSALVRGPRPIAHPRRLPSTAKTGQVSTGHCCDDCRKQSAIRPVVGQTRAGGLGVRAHQPLSSAPSALVSKVPGAGIAAKQVPLTLPTPLQNILCDYQVLSDAEYAELELYRSTLAPFFVREYFYRNSPQSCDDVLYQDLTRAASDAWTRAMAGIPDDSGIPILGPSQAWLTVRRRLGVRPDYPTQADVSMAVDYIVNHTRGPVYDVTCQDSLGFTRRNQIVHNVPLVAPLPRELPWGCHAGSWVRPERARHLFPLPVPPLTPVTPRCVNRTVTESEAQDICAALGIAADIATGNVPLIPDVLVLASPSLVTVRNVIWRGAFYEQFFLSSCEAFIPECFCSRGLLGPLAAAFAASTVGGVGAQPGFLPGRCTPPRGLVLCCRP